MDLNSALSQIKLRNQNLELCSQLDIELLVLDILKISKNDLYRDNPLLSQDQQDRLLKLIDRRENGEPLAYIREKIGFWNLDLHIDKRVLVPRPETEVLVERILENFNSKKLNVLDLGTGSGAIGLALCSERPLWNIVCSDLCPQALSVARKNMKKNLLKVQIVNACWLDSFVEGRFDIIVSNPPYLSFDDPNIFSDGLRHEPLKALVAENHGIKDIEEIIVNSAKLLADKGSLFVEFGNDQTRKVVSLFKKNGYSEINLYKDLNGDERFCSGKITKC